MDRKYFGCDLTVKAATDAGNITAYASVFNVVDKVGDVVMPGAFAKSLAKRKAAGENLPMFYNHDTTIPPIGHWNSWHEDSKGLLLDGQIYVENEIPRQVHSGLRGGALKRTSIGYSITDADIAQRGDSQVLELKELELWETSIVPFAANDFAEVQSVKASSVTLERIKTGEITIREVEQFLRDAGLSRKQAKAFCAEGFAGLIRDENDQLSLALQQLISVIED